MDPVEKDIEARKSEIVTEVRAIFKSNMKFTDWNVPEADDRLAGELIIQAMQEAVDGLRSELEDGKYDTY